MTTTQLPTTVADLTAGHVAQALRATGHDARIDYQGHGLTEVNVPLQDGRRILVHTFWGNPLHPETATLDTDDGWPGVAIAEGAEVSDLEADSVWLDREAPDVPQLYASLTVAELLSFTVAAVAELKARQ